MGLNETGYLLDLNHDKNKEIDFLFLTPWVNGSIFFTRFLKDKSRRMIIGRSRHRDNNKKIMSLFKSGLKTKNILISSHCNIGQEVKDFINKNKINLSFYEHGWFPSSTVQFDPQGFSYDSLLSDSRLDNFDIDQEKIKKDIEKYKAKYIKFNKFNIDAKYIVVILQFTKDVTIKNGFPDFKGWQNVVDFAESIRNKNEIIIVKMHPKNYHLKESVVMPIKSMAIQDSFFNDDILSNAELVIGVNTTMLYEASLLYNKPVIALGESWFNGHPEVVKKVKITDTNIERPVVTESDINYRMKMFYFMTRMQAPLVNERFSIEHTKEHHKKNITKHSKEYIESFLEKHYEASKIKKIEDWIEPSYKMGVKT